jgi:hypothetical protein
MSLVYGLEIATNENTQNIASFIANTLGIFQFDAVELRGEAVSISIGKLDRYSSDLTFKTFGVYPTHNITFHLYSDEDEEQGKKIIGESVAILLRNEKGDALFHFNGDYEILRRVNGYTSINNEYTWDWLTAALDKASINYNLCQPSHPSG